MKTPSLQQGEIMKRIVNTRDSLLVEACAGSGKTTTLEMAATAINSLNPAYSILYVVFNKGIQKEAKARFGKKYRNLDVLTSHGLGLRDCNKHAMGDITVDQNKLYKLISRTEPDLSKHKDLRSIISYVLAADVNIEFSDSLDQIINVARFYGIESDDLNTYKNARQIIHDSREIPNILSYDDMIDHPLNIGYAPAVVYDFILVDEAQDLNNQQMRFITRYAHPATRYICVGDRYQCQPAGTMVTMEGGTTKDIKDIKTGDKVVSFDRHAHCFVGRSKQGREILAIQKHKYTGNIISVTADDKETRCTDNHKWFVRFTNKKTDIWVTYLMRKDNKYRVGWCQLFTAQGANHLLQRSRIERADACWILNAHRNKEDASLDESLIAAQFGLPLVMFKETPNNTIYTQDRIDSYFSSLLATVDLEARAVSCLLYHNRNMDLPFASVSNGERRGRTTCFEIEACNLLGDGLMSVPSYNGQKDPNWKPLHISNKYEECYVYSLKVDTHELYVADGILTHNSIYGFRGANFDAMDTLKSYLNLQELPLSVCYRCGVNIINLARTITDTIEAAPNAVDGVIITRSPFQLSDTQQELTNGDMVVCRTNAPLIKMALNLLRDNKKPNLLGRDFGESLINMVTKFVDSQSWNSFFQRFREYNKTKLEELLTLNRAQEMEILQDRVEAIGVLCEGLEGPHKLIPRIKSIFAEAANSGITLSTIHKSKGLEASKVVILDYGNIPHPMAERSANKEQALRQEINLKYVAITRAKHTLIMQDLEKR